MVAIQKSTNNIFFYRKNQEKLEMHPKDTPATKPLMQITNAGHERRWTETLTDRGNTICPFHHSSNGGGIIIMKASITTPFMNSCVSSFKCALIRWILLAYTVFQGPVVHSVVSLTSSLRVILLTVLMDSIYNILIFFAEKM